MAAASAATGFRSWLQTQRFGWLTPRRLRGLTLAAMSAAGLVSTIGLSGSTTAAAGLQRNAGASAQLAPSGLPASR